MKDDEQKKIFSKNLRKYMCAVNKPQSEVAKAIGVSPQTFNTWFNGIALPRMGKVQALADYFHCYKSDLIEDKPTPAATSSSDFSDAAGCNRMAPSDVMDIVNQYGTDTPEQRAALSAALDAVDIPAEKRELIQRILKMEPKQVAEVLELLQLADRMRQQ